MRASDLRSSESRCLSFRAQGAICGAKAFGSRAYNLSDPFWTTNHPKQGLLPPNQRSNGFCHFCTKMPAKAVRRCRATSPWGLNGCLEDQPLLGFAYRVMLFLIPNTPWDSHICLHWGGLGGQCRHIWHTWSVWVWVSPFLNILSRLLKKAISKVQ